MKSRVGQTSSISNPQGEIDDLFSQEGAIKISASNLRFIGSNLRLNYVGSANHQFYSEALKPVNFESP
jgi:hypothetical protein